MLVEHQFIISLDFANGVVPSRLLQEIRDSAVIIAVDHIDTVGDVCSVWFKSILSSEDELLLQSLVSTHSGEPVVSDSLPVVIDAPAAATGVPGIAPAKGLGGYIPDPFSNPYNPDVDEVVSHYVDLEGAMVTRGKIFTDEGSFREDFTGDSLVTTLSGTVIFSTSSTSVYGSGTIFTSIVNRNYYVRLAGDDVEDWVTVARVPSDNEIVLDEQYGGTSNSGTIEITRWIEQGSGETSGSVAVSGSKITLSSATGSDSRIHIHRFADYAPISSVWLASLSQRIDSQEAYLGFRDDQINPSHYCEILFSGTNSSSVCFKTAWDNDEQSTVVTLPSGLLTNQTLRYKIDLNIEYCSLLVNGVLLAKHNNHIPDMYAEMKLCAGITNFAEVSNTDLSIDTVLFIDHDQIQIGSMFDAPIPIRISEDQHTILGKLVTNSTTQDQIIVAYTVPVGKVLYLIGYRVDNESSSVGLIKIGRQPVGDEPDAPGRVGSLFRSFNLDKNLSSGEIDMGSNPRQLGVGGDQIVITVTPKSKSPSVWHGSLDFVLR